MERTDDELLVAGVTDVEAFAAFYHRHAALLAGFFLARTGNRELAADLTAETFAAALGARRRFDPAKGPAVGWLYGIARHKLMKAFERGAVEDRARKRLRMNRLVLDDEALEQVEAAADGSRAVQLLDGLPEDQRAAIAARVIEERDYAEIAAATRTSESVIRKRVSRGLAVFRRPASQERPPAAIASQGQVHVFLDETRVVEIAGARYFVYPACGTTVCLMREGTETIACGGLGAGERNEVVVVSYEDQNGDEREIAGLVSDGVVGVRIGADEHTTDVSGGFFHARVPNQTVPIVVVPAS